MDGGFNPTPYAYYLFLHFNARCDPQDRAARLYQHLLEQTRTLTSQHVFCHWSSGSWEGSEGPLLAVYPDAIWYYHVDAPLVDKIVDEHLRHGHIVRQHALHWSYPILGLVECR